MAASRSVHDVADLLAHREWLSRLAYRLAAGDPDADDAVQDAWLAALRSPPDADRDPRPWFARVLANAARKRWRAQSRRRARETEAARAAQGAPGAPDLQQTLERVELEQLVGQLVTELDEPYRATVLLRYFEDLDSTAIAELQGVAAGTVRWRLKEALDRMRRRLDERHGGERRAWAVVALAARPVQTPRALPRALGGWTAKVTTAVVVIAAVGAVATAVVRRREGRSRAVPAPVIGTAFAGLPSFEPTARAAIGPEVRGRVVDREGRGVAEATVTAWLRSELPVRGVRDPAPDVAATSDPDGRFALTLPAGSRLPVQLAAAATGHAPARALLSTWDEANASIELRLGVGGFTIRGTVSDLGGGPIGGAKIRATVVGLPGVVERTSGPDGRFDLTLARGNARVTVSAAGYVRDRVTIPIVGDHAWQVTLLPGAVAMGRVVDAAGAPGAGAIVRATPVGHAWAAVEVTADAAGNFAFDGLAPGGYQLSAGRNGELASLDQRVDLGLAERRAGLELRLAPGHAITGTVRDDAGRPIADARVRLVPMKETGWGLTDLKDVARTLADGTYRVEGLWAGAYVVAADTRERAPASRAFEVGAADVGGLDLVLAPGARVTGRVLSTQGEPVAGAQVYAIVRDKPGMDARVRYRQSATSDGQGRFELSGAATGALEVTASHPALGEAKPATVAVESASTVSVELRFVPAAFVSGIVRTEDGAPAVGVRVSREPHEATLTDERGHFQLGPLVPKTHPVKAEPAHVLHDWFTSRVGPDAALLNLHEGEHREGVELVVPRSTETIEGRVVDEHERGVAGAWVAAELSPALGRVMRLVVTQTESDADGRFVLRGLAHGKVAVFAAHAGVPDVELAHVAIGSKGVVLRMQRPGSVSGRVVDDKGAPIVDATIAALVPGDAPFEIGGEHGIRQELHDPGGAFTLPQLAPGAWDLVATAADGKVGIASSVRLTAGEQTRDVLIRVGRGAAIVGRVVEHETGAPVRDLGISLAGRQGHVHARTDRDGRFRIDGLPPGRPALISLRAFEAYLPDHRRIEIPARATDVMTSIRLLGVPASWRGRDPSSFGAPELSVSNGSAGNVFDVESGSAAARAGLATGDRVLTVDGRDVRALGPGTIAALLRGPKEAPVALEVDGVNGRRHVTLPRDGR